MLLSRATEGIAPSLRGLPGLFRHLPFGGPMLLCLPVLALASRAGEAGPWAPALLLPFVLLLTAGYAYNDLRDRRDPPGKGNPVAAGLVEPGTAGVVTALFLAASGLSFALLYRQASAGLAFLLLVLLSLAYSGLGVRLKETLAGPPLGALALWVGAPLVLAMELGELDPGLAMLLAASWVAFTACELAHTLVDFEADGRSGYRTFAQRLGFGPTLRLQRGFLLIGTGAWLWAAARLLPPAGALPGTLVLAGVALVAVAAGLAAGPDPVTRVAARVLRAQAGTPEPAARAEGLPASAPARLMAPYGALKRGFAALTVLLLGLPPAETGLLLWLCLTIKLR
jgi:4-hydroxybenzoate polyprenyltransferase